MKKLALLTSKNPQAEKIGPFAVFVSKKVSTFLFGIFERISPNLDIYGDV